MNIQIAKKIIRENFKVYDLKGADYGSYAVIWTTWGHLTRYFTVYKDGRFFENK